MRDLEKSQTGHSDKRGSGRRRTLFKGKVVYSQGAHSLDCAIRDLSKTGARISLAKGQSIPSLVYLIDLSNRIAYEAKVEWCLPPAFGLVFLKTHPIAEISDPRLDYLKQLWAACSAR